MKKTRFLTVVHNAKIFLSFVSLFLQVNRTPHTFSMLPKRALFSCKDVLFFLKNGHA